MTQSTAPFDENIHRCVEDQIFGVEKTKPAGRVSSGFSKTRHWKHSWGFFPSVSMAPRNLRIVKTAVLEGLAASQRERSHTQTRTQLCLEECGGVRFLM